MSKKTFQDKLDAGKPGTNFKLQYLTPLTEADFDKDKRTVKVTVIKAGWSKNNIYYPESVLEQIGKFISTSARKVYVDHHDNGLVATRKMAEWVADVVETHIEGDELKAVIKIHNNGPYSWLYERMQSSDVVFGPSIVGVAEVVQGEAAGKEGRIVRAIKLIASFDIVSNPAAGGKIDSIVESALWEGSDDSVLETEMRDYLQKLKDREKKWAISEKMYLHMDAYRSMVRDLVLAENDFAQATIEDRKKSLTQASADMTALLIGLEFLPPIKAVPAGTKQVASTEESPAETVKQEEDTKIQESVNIEETETMETITTIEKLMATYPELTAQLTSKVLSEAKSVGELKTVTEELNTWKTRAEAAEAKVTEQDTELVQLKADKETLTEQVATYTAEKMDTKKAGIIAECIKIAELPEFAVTDTFKETLSRVTFDPENEATFTEAITALVEDRKTLAANAKPTTPPVKVGSTKVNTKTAKVSEGETGSTDNKAALAMLTRK